MERNNGQSSKPSASVRTRVKHLLFEGDSPFYVLILAAFIGCAAGLLGTVLDVAVHAIGHWRSGWLHSESLFSLPTWLVSLLLSTLLAAFGYYLVHRFAPEAAGSGIQEIEGALENKRQIRWQRILPVKFFGGISALGAGLVLGREGPTVQMGGAAARMTTDLLKLKDDNVRQALLAAGAGGGISAAFNAPLAGIMFVVEEMRPQFRYSLMSIHAVIIASVMADVVYRMIAGQSAEIQMPDYTAPALSALWLFLLLGGLFGVLGVVFNKLIAKAQDTFVALHQNKRSRFLLLGATIGATFGLLVIYMPQLTGGGIALINIIVSGEFGLGLLLLLFLGRLITTLICFCSGAPGGVFAPMLALGTLFGYSFGVIADWAVPSLELEAGMFAVAGMGALFAASVRAPITGILLVIEMTNNYFLILPLIVTSLGAVIVAQWCGGEPLYTQLLRRTLKNSQSE
ncbi:H(+)/Cl(-) exchange transporter ClcA [Vibrio sp. SM6]|uniref:H(+)/Cl(-) exchange transporter ClcA n=1 Tax=Vibrio agarilyticus TaxID=2726741 RepID=A0A7X8TSI4_9VIBR|nr:H(+)/Cl(-) exchange transporter ClcA [Vibrio agarilyticus]NLS13816.1 H(+)/Cl(-) exchange transporter ClcA [Vibrio agarilyticus]